MSNTSNTNINCSEKSPCENNNCCVPCVIPTVPNAVQGGGFRDIDPRIYSMQPKMLYIVISRIKKLKISECDKMRIITQMMAMDNYFNAAPYKYVVSLQMLFDIYYPKDCEEKKCKSKCEEPTQLEKDRFFVFRNIHDFDAFIADCSCDLPDYFNLLSAEQLNP